VGLIFRELINGKVNASTMSEATHSFLSRSPFMEIILRDMIADKWDDEALDTLTRMVTLFSSSRVTNRQLQPYSASPNTVPLGSQPPIQELFSVLSQDLLSNKPQTGQANHTANMTPADAALDHAFAVSGEETMPLDDLYLKLMEEVGELSIERLIEKGLKHPKYGGTDGVRGEAVDVALMGLSIFVKHGGSREEFLTTMLAKSTKWKNTLIQSRGDGQS
jgi:hypothetical protein